MPRIRPKPICESENIFNLDKEDYLCKYDICHLVAQYGYEEENPVYCKYHNFDEEMFVVITMNNLKNILLYDLTKTRYECAYITCKKQSSYNFEDELKKKKLFCSEHKFDNMIYIGKFKCINCKIKFPSYNIEGEPKALYCLDCKKPEMVNVIDIKCIKCKKVRPRFNDEGLPPRYCASCKTINMVNVVNQMCIKCHIVLPTFNYDTESTPLYCVSCKEIGMVDVKTKKCIVCKMISASFNYPGMVAEYCASHKNAEMVDVITLKCIKCKLKIPNYNYPGLPVRYCATCKETDMINLNYKKCITEHCDTRASNPNYRGYCLYCFIYTFPDEPITRFYMVKEKHVCEYLKETYPELHMTFNRKIVGGCSKKRPDAFIECLTHSIIVEVDENQHQNYSCENKRIMMLFEDLGSRPMILIRINPDKYINEYGEEIESSFKYHKSFGVPMIRDPVEWKSRLEKLKETIDKYMSIVPNKEVTIEYLFYDSS